MKTEYAQETFINRIESAIADEITIQEIAKRAGISTATIWRLRAKERNPLKIPDKIILAINQIRKEKKDKASLDITKRK